MAGLPSIGDLLIIVVLIAPGFFSIAILRYISGLSIKMEQFEKMVWSVIMSVPIGVLFIYIHKFRTFDGIQQYVFEHPITSIVELSVLSFIISIVATLILRVNILGYVRNVMWWGAEKNPRSWPLWDDVMVRSLGRWVLIKGVEDEYVGWIKGHSTDPESRCLLLGDPELVRRNREGKAITSKYGNELVLFEEEIKSLVFLD